MIGIDPDRVDGLRAWSYRRQLLDRSAADPEAALDRVLAVHSTHPPAPLSLLARTQPFTWDAFAALEMERRAVNLPVMRGSVHVVPKRFAPAMFAATRQSRDQIIKRFGEDRTDPRSFDDLHQVLLPRLDRPIAGSRIRQTLGISEREFLALRLMSRTGEVLRVSTHPRSDRLMYVSTEAWLGAPLADVSPAEGRKWLARRYFDAFGPARLKDFAWWFSASQKDARTAIEQLDLVDLGAGLLLPAGQEKAFRQTPALDPGAIAILPKWDSYTMGYAPDGRQRLVRDDHLSYAYTTPETRIGATTGDGLPLVLQGGRAIARWSHRFSGKTMTVEITPFPGESLSRQRIEPGFEDVASLMQCTQLRLTITSLPPASS